MNYVHHTVHKLHLLHIVRAALFSTRDNKYNEVNSQLLQGPAQEGGRYLRAFQTSNLYYCLPTESPSALRNWYTLQGLDLVRSCSEGATFQDGRAAQVH